MTDFTPRLRVVQAALSLLLLVFAFATAPALAGPGHSHGDEAPASNETALPRFALASGPYELVGVLDGRHLVMYLDDAASNAPVTDAQLAVELGGQGLTVQRHDDGEFLAELASAPKAGTIPVAAMVTVGSESVRLAGGLDLHDGRHADDHEHGWIRYGLMALGAVLLLLMALAGTRRLRAAKQSTARSAAHQGDKA